jgi:hypothetical protein
MGSGRFSVFAAAVLGVCEAAYPMVTVDHSGTLSTQGPFTMLGNAQFGAGVRCVPADLGFLTNDGHFASHRCNDGFL